MADTRTFRNYVESLPVGASQYLVGANDRRVPATSEGLPAGGTTGQAMIKLSDEDYDAGWASAFVTSLVGGTGITIDATDPRNPIVSADAAGTVTSVDMTVPTGFAVAGGPITGSGTFSVTFSSGYQGYTSSEATKLAGIASGADVTGAAINAAANKTTPSDTDKIGLWDGALKSLTWANVKATLKTYFDTLYGALATANLWAKTQRGTIVMVSSGTTITLDLDLGQEFRINSPGLAHNATLQLSNANNHIGAKFSFTGYNNAGGNTLSYGTGLTPIGAASAPAIPTGAGAKWRVDGQITASGEYQFTTRGVGV